MTMTACQRKSPESLLGSFGGGEVTVHHPSLLPSPGQKFMKGRHPFATVDSKGFREMCKALNPKYSPPSRSYLSDTLIPTWYGIEKANVISEIKDEPKLAITSDGWTSLSQDHYLTVTVHYTIQGILKQKVLHTRAVYKSQTGEVVAEEISDILKDFVIEPSKIVAVTVDNAERCMEQFPAIQAAALDPRLRKAMTLDRLKDEDFHKAEEF
ncbi:hypothetical protein JOQ06_029660, partial [Pogonophryne albipinna]